MSLNKVRRNDKIMSTEAIGKFIESQTIAHLCMNGTNGYPYVVPLNYAYVDHEFILHSAMKGQKYDFLAIDNRVCLTVSKQHYILTDGLVPCNEFKTPYTSVIAAGKASMPEGEIKIKYLTEFVKYNMKKDDPPVTDFDLEFMMRTCVIIITIDQISGKSSFEGV